MITLHELIKYADHVAQAMFKDGGEVEPLWHAITRDGKYVLIPAPPVNDKDMATALIRGLFEDQDVVQYVFVDEAWVFDNTGPSARQVSEAEMKEMAQHGVADHPDRIEAVMFIAESDTEIMTGRRTIERPAGGKAKLGPLVIDDRTNMQSEGRLIGLLPRRGRLQ